MLKVYDKDNRTRAINILLCIFVSHICSSVSIGDLGRQMSTGILSML